MDQATLPPWINRLLWRIVVVVLLTTGALWTAWRLRSLLLAVLVALFLSFAFEPAVYALSKRGWPRGRATGVVMLSAVLGVIGIGLIVLPPFVRQVASLLEDAPVLLESLGPEYEFFGVVISLDAIVNSVGDLGELMSRYASTIAERLAGVFGAIGSLVVQTFSVLLFSYFLLADGPRLRRRLFAAFSGDRQREIAHMWDIAIEKTGGYVASRAQLALVSAVVHSVAFAIIGLPSPVAYGIWVGAISQFIPAIGAYLAAILPALAGLSVSPSVALVTLVVLIGYQQVENYWLAPKVTAQRMALHPAIGFGAAVAGILLMGALGAFLALPVAAIAQAFVSLYTADNPVEAALSRDEVDTSATPPKVPEPAEDA